MAHHVHESPPVMTVPLMILAIGSAGVVAWLSAHIRKLETGFLQNYALAIVLGVALIVGYLVGL